MGRRQTDTSDDILAGLGQVIGDEPTPEFAAQIVEEFRNLLDRLQDETLKQVALFKMDGYTIDEMAEKLGCSRRSIARKQTLIRKRLEEAAP